MPDHVGGRCAGLQPGDLIIVAGRPSMGKTTFAMNLVENAVLRSEKAVLVYSLEMPGESLIMRMLSSLGRIDQTKVRAGRLEDDDWPRLTSAVNLLNDRKLFIDDTAGISPSEMRARTRRLVREHTLTADDLIYPVFVVEGEGYDLHWDMMFDCQDKFIWDRPFRSWEEWVKQAHLFSGNMVIIQRMD